MKDGLDDADGDDGDAAAVSGHGDNGKYSLALWTLWDGYFLSRAIGRNSFTLRSLHSYTHLPLKSQLLSPLQHPSINQLL